MTPYVFLLRDGNRAADRTEASFETPRDMRAHAIASCARARPEGSTDDGAMSEWQMIVTDAAGATVFIVNFLGQHGAYPTG